MGSFIEMDEIGVTPVVGGMMYTIFRFAREQILPKISRVPWDWETLSHAR